jgi:hypothetical protein
MISERTPKDDLLNIVNGLPPDKIALLLEIGRLIKFKMEYEQEIEEISTVKGGSFHELRPLVGRLTLGGDAVEDSEEYWR